MCRIVPHLVGCLAMQHGVAWRLDVHLLRVVHRAVRVLLVVRVWASVVGTGVGACLTAVCVVRPAATSSQASVRTQHCSVLPSDISPSLLRSRRCVCGWVAVVDAISQESPIDGEEAAQPGPRSANKAPSPAAASGVELTSMRPGTPQVQGIGVGAVLTHRVGGARMCRRLGSTESHRGSRSRCCTAWQRCIPHRRIHCRTCSANDVHDRPVNAAARHHRQAATAA